MFCKYCGAKVDEGRSYCPACGRGVSVDTPKPAPTVKQKEVIATPVVEKKVEFRLTAPILAMLCMLAVFACTFFIGIGQNGFASQGESIFYYFKEVYQEIDLTFFSAAVLTGEGASIGAKLAIYVPTVLTTIAIAVGFVTPIVMFVLAALKTKKAKAENQPVNLKKHVAWSFAAYIFAVFCVVLYSGQYLEGNRLTEENFYEYVALFNQDMSLGALIGLCVCVGFFVAFLVATQKNTANGDKVDVKSLIVGIVGVCSIVAFLEILGVYGAKISQKTGVQNMPDGYVGTFSSAGLMQWVYSLDGFIENSNHHSQYVFASLSWAFAFLTLVFACLTTVAFTCGKTKKTVVKCSLMTTLCVIIYMVFMILFAKHHTLWIEPAWWQRPDFRTKIRSVGVVGPIIAAGLSIIPVVCAIVQKAYEYTQVEETSDIA